MTAATGQSLNRQSSERNRDLVDSHAHILLEGYASLKPTAPEVLVEQYASLGVRQVWYSCLDALVGNQLDQHRRCNDRMAELQRDFPDHFVGMVTVNPRFGDEAARELERGVNDLYLKILKIHGWLQPVSCVDPCLEPLLEVASKYALPIVFHDGTPPFTSSLQIGMIARRYPRCKVILGHGGLKDLGLNALQVLQRYPNTYLQTDGPTPLALRRVLDAVGPERILFGTDGGYGDLAFIDYNIRKIDKWDLNDTDRDLIFRRNARRLIEQAETP